MVRGKLHGRHIEFDERVDELDGEVEVFVRSVGATPRQSEVLEMISSMPEGTRGKADIDRHADVFAPGYGYTLDATSSVPSIVTSNAGPRQL